MSFARKNVTDVLLLAGGGVDSTVCLHLLSQQGCKCRLLHVDFQQLAAREEWAAVQRIGRHYSVSSYQIEITNIEPWRSGEQLGRNALFIFLALTQLRESERTICLGIHAGTPFYDCSESFFKSIERLVAEHSNSTARLIAPLVNFTKPEIVALATRDEVPLDITYSCQQGVKLGCGKCHSCLDRKALKC